MITTWANRARGISCRATCPSKFTGGVEGAGRRIRTDDLLITNQLLYQLSYAGILRAETPLSAAISALTVYAIFYGMPVGRMEH